MKLRRFLPVLASLLLPIFPAHAAETLTISVWGGTFRDALAESVGKRFTEQTGVELKYVTGSAVTRLNKEKLAQGADTPDVLYTTGHVGWLYKSSNLLDDLDVSKIPNVSTLPEGAMLSPAHIGAWSYVYTICYRQSLVPTGMTVTSWNDLWNPELKGMIGLHEIDPSHIIAVASKLSGVDAANWTDAQPLLLKLKPNIKAYYASDAMSQDQLSSGETPISVALASNCYHLAESNPDIKVSIPNEGAVGSTDVVAVMSASTKKDLAYKYINLVFDPQVQSELAKALKVSPANPAAVLPDELKDLPGIYANPEKFRAETIFVDNKLRSEKLGEWRQWFSENMMNR